MDKTDNGAGERALAAARRQMASVRLLRAQCETAVVQMDKALLHPETLDPHERQWCEAYRAQSAAICELVGAVEDLARVVVAVGLDHSEPLRTRRLVRDENGVVTGVNDGFVLRAYP